MSKCEKCHGVGKVTCTTCGGQKKWHARNAMVKASMPV